MNDVTLVPIFDQVVVTVTDGRGDALTVIDRVVAGLERAGLHHAAAAFVTTAGHCDTDDEILAVARDLVTVIE